MVNCHHLLELLPQILLGYIADPKKEKGGPGQRIQLAFLKTQLK